MEGYTMGGYADLPPHERPGYMSPTGQQPPQWSYTPNPVNSQAPQQPIRTPAGGYQQQQQSANYQYSQPEGIKYTAQPITSQSGQQYPPPPPISHRYSSSSVTSPTHNVTAMPMPQQYFPPPPSGPPPSKKSDNSSKKGRERSRSRVRDDRREKEKEKDKASKRVKIYDAEEDASAILKALAQRDPDADVLIDILPALSHDQLMELRNEYKRVCKVQGRGVNLAKHIKMKVPSSNFGKICHITALGRWESEAYWANYWYQGNNSKRELLIESLMGRSNYEIREIIDSFKDKRYGDDLIRCMETELKKDKFRMAVLMTLDANRQEEGDVWSLEHRNRDVDVMYGAVKAREGGESDILRIICLRSDAHLRECLEVYKRKYQSNFAKDVLRKSNNLVGEVCAHILNGVINRPARDAMLLHHALTDLMETGSDRDSSRHERQHRYELLISRLVRLHWDKLQLRKVKLDYREKYGRYIEDDIEDATKGDFREFCIALCDLGLGTGR
ncbi:Ankyrin repeat protein [Neofusicoccum parvum]|uniref:Putative annexin anxc4 protein n=1 Tax=Botryosphaeria parva (strain UCR-NP2) TaxID=1287680 RepID=R1EEW6_BOTPV|nr:putative annexin anxc4 protein [Neofusicoccum parvum UCRNP2]GME65433.1 Ankyrin repeat protein [Neofusicoccum parvum]